jgi:Ran GTPase-activating protein (RanGAP) involved in mRNA processing and transport
LKVNSTLTSMNLKGNVIGTEGATEIAEVLKVNSILTYMNLKGNDIGMEGEIAIAEALKVNSTLKCLGQSIYSCDIEGTTNRRNGVLALLQALRFNPTLSNLNLGNAFTSLCREALTFAIDTQHHLNGLLKTLIGEDGAIFLANEFRMKVRRNVFDIETKVKQIELTTSLSNEDDESMREPDH